MDDVMIALLPITTDWCRIELPHLTLVYSGKIEDHPASDFNAMAKDASSIAAVTRPIMLQSTGTEVLGPDSELVNVIKLRPTTELIALRNFVKQWDLSGYTSYIPHCTIGPASLGPQPIDYPSALAFDRILVGWGDEQVTFWLRR